MATWKKVIVSGSAGEFTSVTSSVLTNDNLVIAGVGGTLENSGVTFDGTTLNAGAASITATGTSSNLSGSFSGSFQGDGSGLTNVPASGIILASLSQSVGIAPFNYVGQNSAVVAVSGAAQLTNNIVTKWDSDAGKFVDSSLTDNGTIILGATSLQLSGASSSLTGSFTGSFKGDGSGLTGLATTLDVSASNGSGISIDLLTQDLTITGTANEIETSAAGTTLTIGLPNDVTIGQDLTVSRNLTVLGTASFQNTTNLDVADRFILLASGSNTAGDGGIVVQQGTQGIGEAFAFDVAQVRWGITGSFNGSTSEITPDAFMAAVVVGAGTDPDAAPARYDKAGNIFVGTDQNIWIYS